MMASNNCGKNFLTTFSLFRATILPAIKGTYIIRQMRPLQLLVANLLAFSLTALAHSDTVYQECGSGPLAQQVKVDGNGTVSTLLFAIDIQAEAGSYTAEKIRIEIVRERLMGQADTAVFFFSGKWQMRFSNTGAGKWAAMNHPLVTATGMPANGEQIGVL
jgi:hypothetical protein